MISMRKKIGVFIISTFIILSFHRIVYALETGTHRAINLKIATSTINDFSLNQYLKSP